MKFIKRFFAKKYTQDEVKAILEKLPANNLVRINAMTANALAESAKMHREWEEKSRLEREAIDDRFEKNIENYQLNPFHVATVNENSEYWQAMFDRIKADLPDKFLQARRRIEINT